MNSRVRPSVLAALVMTVPLMACARAPEASAGQAQTAPAVAAAAAPAAPLVTGLPDFTGLVEQVGPAVVNIEATIGPRQGARSRGGLPDGAQIPEIFRRMFPDMMPGMPPGHPDPGAAQGRSVGSGFLISADGYILTNHHVVDGAERITVRLSDRRELEARLVGGDPTYDVALLKVEGKGLPVLRQGKSAALKPGQWVVAIGSPLGLEQSVTAGIVSAVGRTARDTGQQYVPFIQTDVAINRGNSGGPLLNTSGEVVGINSQILSNSGGYMGVSFAIPIDLAMSAAEQIKTSGKVSRGMLGVVIQPVEAGQAKALGLDAGKDQDRGVAIVGVEGREAREARLAPGMAILQVGRTPVGSVAALERELRGASKGDTVMLLVRAPGGANQFVALAVGADG